MSLEKLQSPAFPKAMRNGWKIGTEGGKWLSLFPLALPAGPVLSLTPRGTVCRNSHARWPGSLPPPWEPPLPRGHRQHKGGQWPAVALRLCLPWCVSCLQCGKSRGWCREKQSCQVPASKVFPVLPVGNPVCQGWDSEPRTPGTTWGHPWVALLGTSPPQRASCPGHQGELCKAQPLPFAQLWALSPCKGASCAGSLDTSGCGWAPASARCWHAPTHQANASPALFHLHTFHVCITHWQLLESNAAISATAQSASQINTAHQTGDA